MERKWNSIEKDGLPEGKEWCEVMTQDGTVFAATYNPGKKVWVPLFRGGQVESLMHGKVVFWAEHMEGYPFIRCDKGHGYLKTPDNAVCPTCASLFGLKKSVEESITADPAIVNIPDTPVEPPVESNEEIPMEPSTESAKPKRTRKKKEEG